MTDNLEKAIADMLTDIVGQDLTAQLTVSSNSMKPILDAGDIVGLRQIAEHELSPGQIITFLEQKEHHRIVTHRISAVWRDEQGVVTILARGDQMMRFDLPFGSRDVIGQVIWRSRDGCKLHLDQGTGKWLSSKLASISEKERKQINHLSIENSPLPTEAILRANFDALNRRLDLRTRAIRGSARAFSQALSAVVLLFAEQEEFQVTASDGTNFAL